MKLELRQTDMYTLKERAERINSYLSHILCVCNQDDGAKYWQSWQIHQSLLFLEGSTV